MMRKRRGRNAENGGSGTPKTAGAERRKRRERNGKKDGSGTAKRRGRNAEKDGSGTAKRWGQNGETTGAERRLVRTDGGFRGRSTLRSVRVNTGGGDGGVVAIGIEWISNTVDTMARFDDYPVADRRQERSIGENDRPPAEGRTAGSDYRWYCRGCPAVDGTAEDARSEIRRTTGHNDQNNNCTLVIYLHSGLEAEPILPIVRWIRPWIR